VPDPARHHRSRADAGLLEVQPPLLAGDLIQGSRAMLVHHFLEHSAERLPDKEALVCGGQRLTYAAVEERANRLAHALRAYGLRPGDRAAVWLESSAEAVVAIFAILKA